MQFPFIHGGDPLDAVVRNWIDQAGFPVLHIRSNKRVRCFCYDPRKGTVDKSCPTCFGAGWTVEVLRRRSVSQTESVPETLSRILRQAEYGRVDVQARSFFVDNQYSVENQDIFVITKFDKYLRPISDRISFYSIHHVTSFRDNEGDIIMQAAYGGEDLISPEVRGIRIRSIRPDVKTYARTGKVRYFVAQED